MSRRAIDRFRPQLAARLQPSSQEHPTPLDPSGFAANYPVESNLSEPKLAIAAESSLVDPVGDQPEVVSPTPAEADVAGSAAASRATPSAQPSATWLTQTRRQFWRGAKVLGVPLIWVGVAAFCGGTGYAAFNWLLTIPPVPECDRLWFFSSDADKLFCVEQAARSGKVEALQAGIKLVRPWGSSHQLYPQASRLHREWSKRLMQLATLKALDNDLTGAINLAQELKLGDPAYQDAKKAVAEWQKLRDRGESVASSIEAALKAQNWKQAEAEIQPQGQISDYQRQELNRLRERLVTERIAVSQLQQVRELVKPGASAETLGRAIQLAMQINPSSYVSEAAKTDIQQWSEALIQLARTRLQIGDVPGAIAVSRWLPATVTLPPDLQDLVWISRAQNLSLSPSESAFRDAQWQYTTVLAALKQIQPVSPLYALAQTNGVQVERQLQDVTQLNLARMLATVPHIPTLQVAIDMAQTVTPDRPQRIAAQTFVAEWRKEIERVQDRPGLMQAKKRAATGKIKDLQAAIAVASQIPLGRALRPEAQAAIFDWRSQIQTIEDQPILAKARQFAQQKQLSQAIQEASKIAAGRALHPEAQTAIATWTATMQTAEDRPILDEARTLATQGNFGTAIDVAFQIAPGRALYAEAQTAIATWTAQLPPRRAGRFSDWHDRHDQAGDSSRDRPPSAVAPPRYQREAPPELPPP